MKFTTKVGKFTVLSQRNKHPPENWHRYVLDSRDKIIPSFSRVDYLNSEESARQDHDETVAAIKLIAKG